MLDLQETRENVSYAVWPADSPRLRPRTFTYTVKLKWFATDTQMANDPVYVDDGSTVATPRVDRTYSKTGRYSEMLRISDKAGNVAYDFAVVIVMDREHSDRLIPSIHPNDYPTGGRASSCSRRNSVTSMISSRKFLWGSLTIELANGYNGTCQ